MTQRERGTREGHEAPGHDGAVDAGVMTDSGESELVRQEMGKWR